jgi:hypothetical protein
MIGENISVKDVISCVFLLVVFVIPFIYVTRWRGGDLKKTVPAESVTTDAQFDREAGAEWWAKSHTSEAHLGNWDKEYVDVRIVREAYKLSRSEEYHGRYE